MSLSYILVTLFLVALISLLTNVLLDKQFRDYIMKEQGVKNSDIVNLINEQYDDEEKTWGTSVIENIGISALEQGLIVKVTDNSGSTVWDATVHNNGLCTQMIDHMSQNMTSRYPNFQGGYEVSQYPLVHGAAQVGNVEIGYYGPFFLTDNNLAFINTLNKMLGSVAVFSLLLALIAGALNC